MTKEEHDLNIELLEVFTNSILYARGIYPPAIFRKRKIYNVSVNISIYPPLNDYLKSILYSARELQYNNQLKRYEIIIYQDNDDDSIVERYVFEFDDKMSMLSVCDKNNDKYLIDHEEEIRKTLLNLSSKLKNLKKLPTTQCRFKINLHTSQSGLVQLSNNMNLNEFPWIKENVGLPKNQVILPISMLKSAGLHFYVEEIV